MTCVLVHDSPPHTYAHTYTHTHMHTHTHTRDNRLMNINTEQHKTHAITTSLSKIKELIIKL